MVKKPKKLMTFDKKVQLSIKGNKVTAFVDNEKAKLRDAIRKIPVIIPSAEQMIQELEKLGQNILVDYGYSDNWMNCISINHETMPEEAYYAYRMLSHLSRSRDLMSDHTHHLTAIAALSKKASPTVMHNEHVTGLSETMYASVRETIIAMSQFIYLKNSEIGENYEFGSVNRKGRKKGGEMTAERRKETARSDHARIIDSAKKSLNNHVKRSDVIKNLAEQFNHTPQSIGRILKKSNT